MALAAEGRGEEFFDSSRSNVRFGKVDKIKGAELLEKVQVRRDSQIGGIQRSPTMPEGFEHAKKPSVAGGFGGLGARFGEFARRDRS